MNRDLLVDRLSSDLSLPRKEVERVVERMVDMVIERLKAGGTVTLSGFGQFFTTVRAGRTAAHPRKPTERIHVPAVRVAKFRAGKRLKEEVK